MILVHSAASLPKSDASTEGAILASGEELILIELSLVESARDQLGSNKQIWRPFLSNNWDTTQSATCYT